MVLILGGGLSGGLLSLTLKMRGFSDFLLVEKESQFGGDHTWSFHRSDVSLEVFKLLKPYLKAHWPAYTVHFTEYDRRLESEYFSLRSEDFHQVLIDKLDPAQFELNRKMTPGESFDFDLVFDSRPIDPKFMGPMALQNFVGFDLHFPNGHGLKEPRIMDARVDQKDAYRFFYSLPFDDKNILVEDTRFERRKLDSSEDWKSEIFAYARKEFGQHFEVTRREESSLPLPLSSQMFPKMERENILPIGFRGGFFNPVTGYSFPLAAGLAHRLSLQLDIAGMKKAYFGYLDHWKSTCDFLFLLNRMLYGAAQGDEKRAIFERFYTLPDDLIARFYQGHLAWSDKAKILVGKPPVSLGAAVRSLVDKSWMGAEL